MREDDVGSRLAVLRFAVAWGHVTGAERQRAYAMGDLQSRRVSGRHVAHHLRFNQPILNSFKSYLHLAHINNILQRFLDPRHGFRANRVSMVGGTSGNYDISKISKKSKLSELQFVIILLWDFLIKLTASPDFYHKMQDLDKSQKTRSS